MELDDLRSQWQKAPATSPPAADFTRLVSTASRGLIDRMRRNAWAEVIATPIAALLPLLLPLDSAFRWLYIGVMVVLVAVMAVYYGRQLRVLRQMSRADVSLRGHLQVLCAGLRQLLRFYYHLTLWTGPVTLALVTAYYVGHELGRPAGPRWLVLGLVVAAVAGLGVLFQFIIIRFTRWYLQRLYGQHLDRLEGQLHELDEA